MARKKDDESDGQFSPRDEDDRPRKRRSRDDDDDLPDEDDREIQRMQNVQIASGGFDRATLRSIAIRQKVILFCILGIFLTYGSFFFLPQEMRFVGAIVNLIIGLIAAIFVFLLAIKVYHPVLGIFFAIFTVLPCIGLLCLLVINSRANAALTSNGIRVGLLGANMSDLE